MNPNSREGEGEENIHSFYFRLGRENEERGKI